MKNMVNKFSLKGDKVGYFALIMVIFFYVSTRCSYMQDYELIFRFFSVTSILLISPFILTILLCFVFFAGVFRPSLVLKIPKHTNKTKFATYVLIPLAATIFGLCAGYFINLFLKDAVYASQFPVPTEQDVLLKAKTTPWALAVGNQSLDFEDIGHFEFMFAHPWLQEGHEYKIWYLPNSRQVLKAELIR